jgi:hypothetical protein
MSWCLLVLSLPTANATARMRAWRALKAAGLFEALLAAFEKDAAG